MADSPEGLDIVLERRGEGVVVDNLRSMSRELILADLRGPGV